MQTSLLEVARRFVASEHLKNVLAGDWLTLHDDHGQPLEGIRGRMGAAAIGMHGHEIGVDLIEMQPGTSFPLHVHPGDHILYILRGFGAVTIDGAAREVKPGDTIFIAAEHPHGVKGPAAGMSPLVFLAFGHPHKHVSAPDRMKVLE